MEKRESKRRLQSLHLIRENSSARDKEKNIPSLLPAFLYEEKKLGTKKKFFITYNMSRGTGSEIRNFLSFNSLERGKFSFFLFYPDRRAIRYDSECGLKKVDSFHRFS